MRPILPVLLVLSACKSPAGHVSRTFLEETSISSSTDPTTSPTLDDPTSVDEPSTPLPSGPRTVMVHLFEWPWTDIAQECEAVLGPAGVAAVQVSPPQEHAQLEGQWYERYQPVSYQLVSRSGDRAAFEDMVARCAAVGVHVYVDAILNHMSFVDEGVGTAGTPFTRYSYPGLYGDADFHTCRRGIEDWSSRWEIQECDLATLPDLDTGSDYVRDQLAGYLSDLVSIGVAGVRLDAAKHMSNTDIAAILERVDGELYVYQEVIDFGGEVVGAGEYTGLGDVTEFRYGAELSRVFREGQLAWLESFGPAWGMLASESAIAFVDNHDNQRGHGAGDPLTFQDERLHELANIFMLAWPYGYPQLMSSYAFDDGNQGPPGIGPLEAEGRCAEDWICEHRRPSMLGMVGFRNATNDAFWTGDWWTNGNDQIAFSRPGLGFFAMNREEASTVSQDFQTSLAPGVYCDVTQGPKVGEACGGRTVTVRDGGWAHLELGPMDAVALHAEAQPP